MALSKVKSGVRTLGTGEIATANIANLAVTATQIADSTVTATQILNSTITTAKMAVDPTNASNLSSGSVPAGRLGNAPTADTAPVLNDIATLALHSAVQNNQAAFNLSNAFIDQYEDSSGIDALNNVARDASEYMASTSATGDYTSTTEAASGTVSTMGIVILYKNATGTATLDTDLVAQVSSNSGTNYTSAPLTAGGTFSTGILIAVSNDITISNTGTAPKFKISFANQAGGSKVTQVHGVALLY